MSTSARRLCGNVMPTAYRLACALLLASLALPPIASAQAPADRHKLVLQVSDIDPMKWGLALNNAQNVQADIGAGAVDIEIVVYGPGIGMLKTDAPTAQRIASAVQTGIKVVACENTMKAMKLSPSDMQPGIGYAPSGVVELMKKQQQGYAYIRP